MEFSNSSFYFLVNAQQFHAISGNIMIWQYEFKTLEMSKFIHLSIIIYNKKQEKS